MILKKQQAMTSNKHCFFSFGRGARPQAHTGLRQIVACDNDVLDRQIDARPVVQGHRRRPSNMRQSADIILNLKMRYSDIVNFNNGGEYDSRPRKSERDQRRDLETCSRSKRDEEKNSSNFWSMASFVCIRLQSKWNDQEGGHRINSFPPDPGEKSPGFFYAWIMDNRIKEQATSNMRQGTS